MYLKQELVAVSRKVYLNKFVAAYDGNISCRTSENKILITRSAVCKGDVNQEDIITLNLSGETISGSGKASTESKLHLFIYNKREDVQAVIHAHPVYLTAFAAAGLALDNHYFPEVALTIGKVPLCNYETPSTDALHLSLFPYIDFAHCFLLQNHGVVATGRSLSEAYFRLEKLEHSAKTLIFAKALGGAQPLPDDKIEELYKLSSTVYGIHQDKRNIF
jgi:L-fuculose-phosphate aldolase